jgi:tetratricopeptide (TPR) repeat protein
MLEVYAGAHAATERFKLFIPDVVLDQMASLGLDDIGALYMASAVFDGDTVETVYLDAPSPRKGLLTLDNGRPISEDSLRLIPEDALLAIGIRCDVARAWDQIWASGEVLAEAYFPQAIDDAGSEIDELADNLGFRLREDLLEALGDEVVIYAGVPTDLHLPKVVASIAIKDADKTHALLQNLLARLPVRVQEVTYGNHTLRVATPTRNRDQAPLSPCYVLTGDRLLISATRSGLEQALDRLADPESRGIVGSPNFREALGALHWKDASAFCYLDTKRVLSLGYEAAYDVLPGLLAGNREIPVDPLALPRLQTFLKHIKSLGGTVVGDEDGIVARARTIGLATIISLAGRTVDRAEGALPWVISRLGNQMFGRGLEPVAPTEVSPGSVPIPEPDVVNPLSENDPQNQAVRRRIREQLAAMENAEEVTGAAHFDVGMDYLRIREYEHAINHYGKARDAGFNVPVSTYNIACCLSLLDRKEEALQWIEKALDAGFNSRPLLDTDTDLNNIRHLPGFKKLRTRLQ